MNSVGIWRGPSFHGQSSLCCVKVNQPIHFTLLLEHKKYFSSLCEISLFPTRIRKKNWAIFRAYSILNLIKGYVRILAGNKENDIYIFNLPYPTTHLFLLPGQYQTLCPIKICPIHIYWSWFCRYSDRAFSQSTDPSIPSALHNHCSTQKKNCSSLILQFPLFTYSVDVYLLNIPSLKKCIVLLFFP